MLRLSKKSTLALETVLDIAFYEKSNPMPSCEITERQGIAHRYLETVRQRLSREGIIESSRGTNGGYTLARSADQITVWDIVKAVHDEYPEKDDVISGSELAAKVVNPLWSKIENDIARTLQDITIADLCHTAKSHNISTQTTQKTAV